MFVFNYATLVSHYRFVNCYGRKLYNYTCNLVNHMITLQVIYIHPSFQIDGPNFVFTFVIF